jgi:hypothetical protein
MTATTKREVNSVLPADPEAPSHASAHSTIPRAATTPTRHPNRARVDNPASRTYLDPLAPGRGLTG